ncbi:putative double-stranded RNA-binding domain-containing protein [Lupinus albus]|uniref:Putative double-stranded RNA-binding domain-containing protein n=1 Tax=Lupinus albus TaxID=3870 RepID=A0A6A4R2G0_LUPAL|nr:putative double-stranded RNA-binding domain-containing protein [Lupinus albus]
MFFKSIMNEYATKLNVAMPTYSTVQIIRVLPVFVSTLVFNDNKYAGDAARNKKEAEHLVARHAIISILGTR